MLLKEQDPMALGAARMTPERAIRQAEQLYDSLGGGRAQGQSSAPGAAPATGAVEDGYRFKGGNPADPASRSEEHTSELQSLMRISYAVFCLKKKNKTEHELHL